MGKGNKHASRAQGKSTSNRDVREGMRYKRYTDEAVTGLGFTGSEGRMLTDSVVGTRSDSRGATILGDAVAGRVSSRGGLRKPGNEIRYRLTEETRSELEGVDLKRPSTARTVVGGAKAPDRYSEAIEAQAALYMDVINPTFRDDMIETSLMMIRNTTRRKDAVETLDLQIKIAEQVLRDGRTHYWGRDTGRIVAMRSAKLPSDFVLRADVFQHQLGYAYFEEAWRCFPDDEIGQRGLAWCYVSPSELQEEAYVHSHGDPETVEAVRNGMAFIFFEMDDPPYGTDRKGVAFYNWVIGQSLQRQLDKIGEYMTSAGVERARAKLQFFATQLLFMQERIQERVTHRADGKAKREAEVRHGRPLKPHEIPSVDVIQLRRKDIIKVEKGEGKIIDWQFRWLVDGHWRDQRVGPGRAEVRKTWVNGYVKGPEDKPMKPASAHLMAVVR